MKRRFRRGAIKAVNEHVEVLYAVAFRLTKGDTTQAEELAGKTLHYGLLHFGEPEFSRRPLKVRLLAQLRQNFIDQAAA
ncbi:MAG: hypothetical protein WC675_04625 [Patescibacteria group bacterium]